VLWSRPDESSMTVPGQGIVREMIARLSTMEKWRVVIWLLLGGDFAWQAREGGIKTIANLVAIGLVVTAIIITVGQARNRKEAMD